MFVDGGRCTLPAAVEGGLCTGHRDRRKKGQPIDTPIAIRRKQDPELLAAGLSRCSKCDEVKPLDAFTNIGNGRRKRTCKSCENKRLSEARKANPDAFKAYGKRAKEKALATDPVAFRARGRASVRRWREAHPEQQNAATNAWYAKNPGYARAYHLRTKYGLTPEQHAALLESQDGLCAICRTDKPVGRHGIWQVDHNRRTGQRRGLLCHHCNVGLGHFQENLDVMRAAIAYLEHWKAAWAAVEPPAEFHGRELDI